jgi:outer membrane protein assembly factor BamB
MRNAFLAIATGATLAVGPGAAVHAAEPPSCMSTTLGNTVFTDCSNGIHLTTAPDNGGTITGSYSDGRRWTLRRIGNVLILSSNHTICTTDSEVNAVGGKLYGTCEGGHYIVLDPDSGDLSVLDAVDVYGAPNPF